VIKLSDEEIMISVKEDKVEMLAILFERHHVKLYNFLWRLTGDKNTSEDMVQEIFFRILKYRHTYRGESKFVVWMYQIARNAHIDHLRKHKKNFSLEDSWEEEVSSDLQPNEVLEKDQDLTILHQALNKLPVRKKEILLLSRFQNLKYREIAELLQCSIEAVKINVHRAMKELKKNYLDLRGGVL
jgi:RNA polymerase sigma-70 factor (ECF subfamily)